MAELADVQGIYFDLDDTLCGYWSASKMALRGAFAAAFPEDDPHDWVRRWATAYRKFAPEVKTPRWYAGYLHEGGPTRTEQMRMALAEGGIHDAELARRIGDHYAAQRLAGLNLFPDARALLDELRPRYPLGLITNGPADVQRHEIAQLGIGDYFPHVFIEGEQGIGKPESEVFQRAAAAMNLPPDRLLMVGNSYHHDILGAIEQGWRTVWIRRESDVPPSASDGAEPEQRPDHLPAPDAVISSLSELRALLGVA
jgi:FMN phosphatase YigB (HAD superfamily)